MIPFGFPTLSKTYFKWDNQFYEQLNGVARYPVSSVIATYYLEAFDEIALSSASAKPTLKIQPVSHS